MPSTARSASWGGSAARSSTATLRHEGYVLSLAPPQTIEEVFGWIKAQAGFAKVKVRGLAKVDAAFTMMAAAYNLRRLATLAANAP